MAVEDIEGADRIQLASVLGWKCIVKKGEFKAGDLAVYIEIDSILPEWPEFEFLREKKFRIKTWKLNKFGVISQGILFPVDILPAYDSRNPPKEDDDVTKILGVTKYEQPDTVIIEPKKHKGIIKYLMKYSLFRKMYLYLHGNRKADFPSFISYNFV